MLAALSLAIGVCVAGYVGWLTLRRGTPAAAASGFEAPEFAPPPAPERLPGGAEFARTPVPVAHREEAPRLTLPLRVRNAAALLKHADAGVAIYRADTGGDLSWTPLANGTARDGVVELAPEVLSHGDYVLTVAIAPRHARHGYVTRASAHVSGKAAERVELDAASAEVTFVVPAGRERVGPFRIVRVGDEEWAAMEPACTGMMIEGKATTPALLGTGTYELVDPLAPERRQRFDVAGPVRVEISGALARARAARQ